MIHLQFLDDTFQNVVKQIFAFSKNNIPRFVSVSQYNIPRHVIAKFFDDPEIITYNIASDSQPPTLETDEEISHLARACNTFQHKVEIAFRNYRKFKACEWIEAKHTAVILTIRHSMLLQFDNVHCLFKYFHLLVNVQVKLYRLVAISIKL